MSGQGGDDESKKREEDEKKRADEERAKALRDMNKRTTPPAPSSSGNRAFDLAALRRRKARTTFSSSSMTVGPDKEFMAKMAEKKVVTVQVATDQEVELIADDWVNELKIERSNVFECSFDLVKFCYHNSSSADQKFIGTTVNEVMLEDVASCVKRHVLLRRFCNKYAAIIWNYGIAAEEPPACWQTRRFKPEVMFAAFDFFDAVTSEAVIAPPTGMIRLPTNAELTAAATSKEIRLNRKELRSGTHAVNDFSVTGGRSGPKVYLNNQSSDEI